MWDLMIAEWRADVVTRNEHHAQPDFNTILQLAANGLITNPGGAPLSSANFLVNCPALGFADAQPAADLAPRPARRSDRTPRDAGGCVDAHTHPPRQAGRPADAAESEVTATKRDHLMTRATDSEA